MSRVEPGTPQGGWGRRVLAPVRVRVTLAATSVALVVGVVGAVLFVASLHRDLERALVASARQQVETITAQLENGSTPAQAAVTARDDVITQILSPRGEIIGSDHPKISTRLRDSAGVSTSVQVTGLDDTYVVVAAVAPSGELVTVAHSQEQLAQARRTAETLLTVALPLGLALLAAAVWLAVGQALRPVESMRREAAQITTAHQDRRLPVPQGGDEISRLALTLNQMLERIGSSQRAQRQFASDASHELRSPLAVIRQLAEVARRHPDQADVVTLTNEILAEEGRMEELVAALLTLARLEDRDPATSHLVDLDDVVLAEVKRARPASGPEIDATGVGAGQVRGEEVLFGQVVRNLLSNALRHARSRVQVSLDEVDSRVRLVVADDGPGIPVSERERVFGRFVRLDDARARDEGGAGLGLAIVERVVTGLQGSVAVDEAPGGGARFTVTLPAAG
ncbi:ATP-binding region, ATPase domain protein [Nocardioides sp. JS614]|nr:ATP-binding region, ATPase domain protein [Nocardioides sp. JS614]